MELTFSDLRLLGKSYMNDFPLAVEVKGDCVRIVAPKSTWKSLTAMTILIALIFCGALVDPLVLYTPPEDRTLLWILLPIIGGAAITGPLVAHNWRLADLRRQSPLIEYSASDKSVSILAGSHRFAFETVYALVGLALPSKSGQAVVCRNSSFSFARTRSWFPI